MKYIAVYSVKCVWGRGRDIASMSHVLKVVPVCGDLCTIRGKIVE